MTSEEFSIFQIFYTVIFNTLGNNEIEETVEDILHDFLYNGIKVDDCGI